MSLRVAVDADHREQSGEHAKQPGPRGPQPRLVSLPLDGASRDGFGWRGQCVQITWFSRNVHAGGLMRRLVPVLLLICACAPATLTAQLTTPTDWKWRQDAAAPLASGSKMEPGSWVFVQMPPGWHVTTGPGVLLYPTMQGDVAGNFSLEAEIFLFPGESPEEYGLFLGGLDIDTSETPDYSAFVLRRDGHAAILRRRAGQTTPLVNWQRHEAIVPHKGGNEPVKNVVRVDVDPLNATLSVNGATVISVPRQDLRADGRIGFRIGKDVNLHISALNVTRRLAPVPVKLDRGSATPWVKTPRARYY